MRSHNAIMKPSPHKGVVLGELAIPGPSQFEITRPRGRRNHMEYNTPTG